MAYVMELTSIRIFLTFYHLAVILTHPIICSEMSFVLMVFYLCYPLVLIRQTA